MSRRRPHEITQAFSLFFTSLVPKWPKRPQSSKYLLFNQTKQTELEALIILCAYVYLQVTTLTIGVSILI